MNHGGYIPRRLRRSSHLATSGSCDAKRRIPRPLGRGSLYEIETKIGPPQSVRLSEGCAPSMGANLWGASPLWEYRLGLNVSKNNHEPKARAKPRGIVRRKPECKRCETTDCKPHSQGRGMLLAMTQGSKAHRYALCRPRQARGPALRQAQTVHWIVCVRAQPTVNAALVHR